MTSATTWGTIPSATFQTPPSPAALARPSSTVLPDFLFDTYRRYKADTGQVVAWLAETAQKSGYALSADSAPASPRGSSGGGAKSKGPKSDRTPSSATTSKATQQQTALTIQQVTNIAEWIARLNPPVSVPSLIVTLLESAISARKRCSQWFQSNARGANAENTTHSHFINVLESVLQILPPRLSTPDTESSLPKPLDVAPPSPDQQIMEVTDNFGILAIDEGELAEVNEDTSTLPQSTTASPSASTKRIPRSYKVETTDNDEEIYFALFCLFTDLRDLRDFLLDLWHDYRCGETDLVTASLTTNLSFDLVRQVEKDLFDSFPVFKSYQDVWSIFYMFMCYQRGIDIGHLQQKFELVPQPMRDVADLVYMNIYRLLAGFCDVLQPHHAPIYRPGHYGIYDPDIDRGQLNDYERFLEDKIIISESMTEFFVLSKSGDQGILVLDELSKGLLDMFRTKKISLSLTFATQVYVDIHHVLRANVKRALTDMRAAGIRASISIQKYRDSPGPRTFENWPQSNEDYVTQIAKFIDDWAKGDALRIPREQIIRPHLPRSTLLNQRFALLSKHPILCGLIQFRIFSLFKDGGSTLAGAWGSVIYVAHLYNACREGGYLEEAWTDMELLMDIHGRESFFAGRVPKTPEEWLKSMSLMLGSAPQAFARRGRRDRGLHLSRKGPKGLSSASPVSDAFQPDISDAGIATLTVETVQSILNTRMTESSPSKSSKESGHQQSSDPVFSQRQSLLATQWSKSHKMTPLQLLRALTHALEIEERQLKFDYFTFHVRCFQVLRQVRDALDADLRKYFGDEYIENESQLSTVVGSIFSVAVDTSHVELKLPLRGFNVVSIMMTKAGNVLKKILENEGCAEAEKLAKVCVHWQIVPIVESAASSGNGGILQ